MGLCTEEEAALVEAYFQEHPEDEALLEEFETTEGQPIDGADRVEMLKAVIKTTRPTRGKVIRRIGMIAAAACVILLAGAGWWMHHPADPKSVGSLPAEEAALWMGKRNTATTNLRIQLPDSTETVLSPGATIFYRKDLGSAVKREVKAEGRIVFSVHQDKQRPFIVYSEGVQTTVLGTIFEVTNEKSSDQITVRLLQGKVMVMADERTDSIKHYILTPGEELVYGKRDRAVVVREFKKDGGSNYVNHRAKHRVGGPDSLANWYMFDNQRLADVFDQLAILYNVEIQYSSVELHNKYFIGRLDRKDSLYKIIRDIALLNHLSVTEQSGCIIIRKRKQ